MSDILDTPWFFWAVGVAVGFPVALVALTELHHALRRREQFLRHPVYLLRNYILPLGALLILLVKADAGVGRRHPGPRRRHAVRLRGVGAGAVGAERDPVPRRAGGHVAQADAVDLPRRGALRC